MHDSAEWLTQAAPAGPDTMDSASTGLYVAAMVRCLTPCLVRTPHLEEVRLHHHPPGHQPVQLPRCLLLPVLLLPCAPQAVG